MRWFPKFSVHYWTEPLPAYFFRSQHMPSECASVLWQAPDILRWHFFSLQYPEKGHTTGISEVPGQIYRKQVLTSRRSPDIIPAWSFLFLWTENRQYSDVQYPPHHIRFQSGTPVISSCKNAVSGRCTYSRRRMCICKSNPVCTEFIQMRRLKDTFR